ncbi:TPA: DEAD/DEAH box helicase family protein [Legionella pneumophila]|nr:DEAD/DEAH box helicase family protein [Legionella pneumophila]HBD9261867.1 DEAD/DEAH box helicase family protein [Legionella pneumophila]HBD9474183.1 DEAD/DEAH box helicase family protein [Legionella pneumophila]HCJ1120159.1 DEAD/DEAH box helicase family protein [Legionella pneumophila]HCJ4287567.1 DEAD/DEAH box helicase family protein [Legionella pneumophila]
MSGIDRLIINSPYKEPEFFHQYVRENRNFILTKGRRPAGYIIASENSRAFDDPGQFVEIPLVNQIRQRVKSWRNSGYLGVTGITKRLLEHWYDEERYKSGSSTPPFFFCQLEAIETLIWLCEGPNADKVGISIPNEGNEFQRLCSKMATGTGKTIVMAMLIAWQILNKISSPRDPRFSKFIFVVAPGLTVKNRLSVLSPNDKNNFYESFNIVPSTMLDKLRQGKIIIKNWHALNWDTEEKIAKRRSVDKRGAKSDEAYVREVLDNISSTKNIIVINDEAHHAWCVSSETNRLRDVSKEDIEEATKWVGGLNRINRARGILHCYDFTATPFAPSGRRSNSEALFGWIVSDFGLNDAIEAGLVKTPRIVIRDDALPDTKTFQSRLYHIYSDPEVKDDINRSTEPHYPLPSLITNAYYLLGYDWRETLIAWQTAGHKVPPVMITITNSTQTASRITYAFNHKKIDIEELCNSDKTLRIDSKVLNIAESITEPEEVSIDLSNSQKKLTKKAEAELLRRKVDTVGRVNQPGEQIRNVISVAMLSEGWDAKTVTHIMGIRAFTSQLLCEQVVGRGLRRMAYETNPETGLFEPEYVNIFGVPFSFLPHESTSGVPIAASPKTRIEADPKKIQYSIQWPNVVRINYNYYPQLELDFKNLSILTIDANKNIFTADMTETIGGKPDLSKATQIQLEKLARTQRLQRIIFQTASSIFDQIKPHWKGMREILIAQVVMLVEKFINSDRLVIKSYTGEKDSLRRRLIITLNMNEVVQHLWSEIKESNQEKLEPVFDSDHPVRSTQDMKPWYTGKPCDATQRSHINFCVHDGTWESTESYELDRNQYVISWVKNDHIGFEISYTFQGIIRKYRPDYLVNLINGHHLILETKGQDSSIVQAKRMAAEEWVKAINQQEGFGVWHYAISFNPKEIKSILHKLVTVDPQSNN